MTFRPLLHVVPALVLAAASGALAETTRQLTQLPPNAADKVAKQDLLSVLAPVRKISSGMRVQLGGIEFSTKPYGTAMKGLCRYDNVTLKYAPVATSSNLRDEPIRPFGIEAEAWYHAIGAPIEELAPESASRAIWGEECRKLPTSLPTSWFRAASDETAARGVNLLAVAIKAVRAGEVKLGGVCGMRGPPVACDGVVLKEGRVDKITEVDACPADQGHVCYKVSVGDDVEVTIRATTNPDSLAPQRIDGVSAEEYLVVT